MIVRAPAKNVWDLLVDPRAIPRFVENIQSVEMEAESVRVGSRRYTMVASNGRRVPCTEFVSVCRPHRTFQAEAKVGMLRMPYEYELRRTSGVEEYRKGAEDETHLSWVVDVELQSATYWLVMPFCLFLPLLIPKLTFKGSYDKMMKQLAAVARADFERE